LLELCLLVALAYWGAKTGGSAAVSLILSIAAPVAAVVIWGAFIAPRSERRLPRLPRLALELALFAAASFALADAGKPTLATIMIAAVALNTALLLALGEPPTTTRTRAPRAR
jgi:hypothetical protein